MTIRDSLTAVMGHPRFPRFQQSPCASGAPTMRARADEPDNPWEKKFMNQQINRRTALVGVAMAGPIFASASKNDAAAASAELAPQAPRPRIRPFVMGLEDFPPNWDELTIDEKIAVLRHRNPAYCDAVCDWMEALIHEAKHRERPKTLTALEFVDQIVDDINARLGWNRWRFVDQDEGGQVFDFFWPRSLPVPAYVSDAAFVVAG